MKILRERPLNTTAYQLAFCSTCQRLCSFDSLGRCLSHTTQWAPLPHIQPRPTTFMPRRLRHA